MAQEPMSTKKATQRVVEILDANYEKADLQALVDATGPHLGLHDKNKLLDLLKEFEELFDRTQCDWRTEPVSFELKEGAKPYHGRPYPVPKIRKETTLKEFNRLCELGGNGVSARIRMGISIIHNTQIRPNCAHDQWFQGSKQKAS